MSKLGNIPYVREFFMLEFFISFSVPLLLVWKKMHVIWIINFKSKISSVFPKLFEPRHTKINVKISRHPYQRLFNFFSTKKWVLLSVKAIVIIKNNKWTFILSQMSIRLVFSDTVKFSGDTLVCRDTQFGKHWIS
jgi:hypothetical protein